MLGGTTLGVIWWADDAHGTAVARTMGMTTFAIANVFFSFAVKDELRSMFSLDTFADRRLLQGDRRCRRSRSSSAPSCGIFQRILGTVSLTGKRVDRLHPRRADDRRRVGDPEALPQVASVATSSALIVCIRFSASSHTSDAADSKTSSVTSIASRPNFS